MTDFKSKVFIFSYQVLFYLWLFKPVSKLCKVPNWYDNNYIETWTVITKYTVSIDIINRVLICHRNANVTSCFL